MHTTHAHTHTHTRTHTYLHLTEFYRWGHLPATVGNGHVQDIRKLLLLKSAKTEFYVYENNECNSGINDYVITLWYSFHLEFSSSKLCRFCPNTLISGCNNDCPYACNMATNCSRFSIPSIPGSDKARKTDVW